jgi:dTDP-4-dehydrorhamnose reductase
MDVQSPTVLITGGTGQFGRALQGTAPANYTLVAPGRGTLDLTDRSSIRAQVHTHQPDVIVNAAAYTNVDRAETEPDAAFAVNTDGPAHLAECARDLGADFVHISTDFVFDGTLSRPYAPDDAPNPLSVYGKSKRAGEERVLDVLDDALIVRTAWLYGGGRDFVHAMLERMRAQSAVRVVADQVGTPTEVTTLARVLWAALAHNLTGLHHWTNAGVASWYDFAVAIAEEAEAQGLIDAVEVRPISSAEFPRPASRPPFSVLDTYSTRDALDLTAEHWRCPLRRVLRTTARATTSNMTE